MNPSPDFDQRSLRHERRMLDIYRSGVSRDGRLLQPLSNACWRAASFELQTHQDAEAVLSLWEESARTLTEGLVRKPLGFERDVEQLLLALNFAIASHSDDVVTVLSHVTTANASSAFQQSYASQELLLVQAYQSILKALAEQRVEYLQNVQERLAEVEPNSSEQVAWKHQERRIIGRLLRVIANAVEQRILWSEMSLAGEERDFGLLMDSALLDLEHYCDVDLDHRPKLYCWLPGVALTLLAADAGMTLGWLSERYDVEQAGYEHLPLTVVQKALTRSRS